MTANEVATFWTAWMMASAVAFALIARPRWAALFPLACSLALALWGIRA